MKKKYNTISKSGFTLAEILITLAVIGVLAAICVPALQQNTQNQGFVVKLKKEYSIIERAFIQVQADNGGEIESLFSGDSGQIVMTAFASKLNLAKNCGTAGGCAYSTPSYNLKGIVSLSDPNAYWSFGNQYTQVILADGTLMVVWHGWAKNCAMPIGSGPLANSCGSITLDLNGESEPNTVGRDIFAFWITETGIFPAGSYGDGNGNTCSKSSSGQGCANKVLTEGAMNY